jgi:hypothetical protein
MEKEEMRIKPSELLFSATLISTSLLGIISGEAFFKGFPSPIWAEWIMLAGGIAIPVLAWFLRSPSRSNPKDK